MRRAATFSPAAATLAILLVAALPSNANTIHVPADHSTIQAGLDAASLGDTVLVVSDTYYEHDIVMAPGVCLTSETGQADCVTIDAQGQSCVVWCFSTDNSASIVGFTIKGGYSASYGGGINVGGGASITMRNVTLTGNIGGGLHGGGGGGMYCVDSSSPSLTDCTFSDNVAPNGGGLFCGHESSPTLTNCTFLDNTASGWGGVDGSGGGMYCASSATLTDCTFVGNMASAYGGGMFCATNSPTLTRCGFVGNRADYGGAMCSFWSSSPSLTNCIIAFSQQGEAIYCGAATDVPSLVCCDLFGNAGGDWAGCIADQFGVDGNFSEDPLFCDMYNDDLTLCANSPCLPGGNDCGVLIGAHGEGCPDCDSPVQMNSWGAIKAMFR